MINANKTVDTDKTIKELVIEKLGEVICMLNSVRLQLEDAMTVKEPKSKNVLLNDILKSTLSIDSVSHSNSTIHKLESIVTAIDKNLVQNEQAKKIYVDNTLAEFGFTDPDSQNVVDVHDASPDLSTFSESEIDDKKDSDATSASINETPYDEWHKLATDVDSAEYSKIKPNSISSFAPADKDALKQMNMSNLDKAYGLKLEDKKAKKSRTKNKVDILKKSKAAQKKDTAL